MTDTITTYTVRDGRGMVWSLTDTERASRLSRAGLTVTAMTTAAEP